MKKFRVYRRHGGPLGRPCWVLECESCDTREEAPTHADAVGLMAMHVRWWHGTLGRYVGPRVLL